MIITLDLEAICGIMIEVIEKGSFVRLKGDKKIDLGIGVVLDRKNNSLPELEAQNEVFTSAHNPLWESFGRVRTMDTYFQRPIYLVYWDSRKMSIKIWMFRSEIVLIPGG